jgi:site-specific DNA-methyltransferase (adenine-specific)
MLLDQASGDLGMGHYPRSADCSSIFQDNKHVGGGPNNYLGDSGGASRYFYTSKAIRSEREAGLNDLLAKGDVQSYGTIRPNRGAGYEESSKARNTHPTLKPLDLCAHLATLLLPPKLDKPRKILIPFAGVMSEAIGALIAGWDTIVCVEREKEYVNIGKKRLAWWQKTIEETGGKDPKALLRALYVDTGTKKSKDKSGMEDLFR